MSRTGVVPALAEALQILGVIKVWFVLLPLPPQYKVKPYTQTWGSNL